VLSEGECIFGVTLLLVELDLASDLFTNFSGRIIHRMCCLVTISRVGELDGAHLSFAVLSTLGVLRIVALFLIVLLVEHHANVFGTGCKLPDENLAHLVRSFPAELLRLVDTIKLSLLLVWLADISLRHVFGRFIRVHRNDGILCQGSFLFLSLQPLKMSY
jgi:hypothetical protein